MVEYSTHQFNAPPPRNVYRPWGRGKNISTLRTKYLPFAPPPIVGKLEGPKLVVGMLRIRCNITL